MKNAIILHGMPSKKEYYDAKAPSMSNAHWLPWLQGHLLKKDIYAVTPEVPLAYDPQWQLWKTEFERYEITPETILVGHSCGGGFIVRWLSENPAIRVGKVVLVAPWINPENKPEAAKFFDFKIDPGLAQRTAGLVIFNSDNDHPTIMKSVARIRETVEEADYREFKNHGHFTSSGMGKTEFPELLEECLK